MIKVMDGHLPIKLHGLKPLSETFDFCSVMHPYDNLHLGLESDLDCKFT